MNKISVIPMPKSVICGEGTVKLSPVISSVTDFTVYAETFKYTANKMFNLEFSDENNGIVLKKNASFSNEEYKITVSAAEQLLKRPMPTVSITE